MGPFYAALGCLWSAFLLLLGLTAFLFVVAVAYRLISPPQPTTTVVVPASAPGAFEEAMRNGPRSFLDE